jgi:prefoldin alpha subunit
MSAVEIQQKISEYANFLQFRLQPELEVVEAARNQARTTVAEYEELKKRLLAMQQDPPKEAEHIVDLGYKTVFCRAVAEDPNTIFVHVGMGFHVEFQIPEAIAFVEKRITFLRDEILSGKEQKTVEVQDHIQSAQMILDELQREMQRIGG